MGVPIQYGIATFPGAASNHVDRAIGESTTRIQSNAGDASDGLEGAGIIARAAQNGLQDSLGERPIGRAAKSIAGKF
jgi:hypothetical protein